MPRKISQKQLVKEMRRFFPDRWEVARMQSRFEGDKAEGTIKIHCLKDDKQFLSDFEAKLDSTGRILELDLDGVSVGKYVGRQHRDM